MSFAIHFDYQKSEIKIKKKKRKLYFFQAGTSHQRGILKVLGNGKPASLVAGSRNRKVKMKWNTESQQTAVKRE